MIYFKNAQPKLDGFLKFLLLTLQMLDEAYMKLMKYVHRVSAEFDQR